jgi:hypothetical protein
MGGLFEVLYDVLFQPRIAMQSIAAKRNISQAITVFLLSILIPIGAMYFGLKSAGMATMIQLIIGCKVFGSIIMWVMGTAVWHLIAEFFGGKGTALGLFSTLGFAHFPHVLIVPLWVIAALMPESVKTILMVVSVLGILFWSCFLMIMGIKEVYQFSIAKAALVIVTPILVMLLIVGIFITFIGSAFTHMPMWI